MAGSASAFASLTKAARNVSESDLASLYTLAWRQNSSSFACPKGTAASFCETLPSEHTTEDGRYLLLGDERAYLNPTTLTGPAPEELYGGMLMLFGPKSERSEPPDDRGRSQFSFLKAVVMGRNFLETSKAVSYFEIIYFV